MTENTFFGLGIAPKLLDVLQANKYVTPTPIQQKAIPIAIEGKDIVGIAQTGTGKTLAFSIPMLQRLAATGGKGLVILPTRELALQVEETVMKIGRTAGIRTAVLIGGASMGLQKKMIERKPHVIVATPGRLNDHLQQGTVKLDDVRVLVLDEADRMLDMGFAPQINKIMVKLPKDRQTMLFSATMPQEIAKMAAEFMKLPLRVEIARQGTTAERVVQEMFVVNKEDKQRLLEKLLTEYKGTVLVFSRTKHGAKKICKAIQTMGHTSAEIHSNRSLAQRKEALNGFKSGKYRVLVATDIAARGIDVTGIELVINFDLPDASEDYVHRIGRTGRAGMAGRAISFATPDQRGDIRQIERLVRTQFNLLKPEGLPERRAAPPADPKDQRTHGGPARHGGGPSRHGRSPQGGRPNRDASRFEQKSHPAPQHHASTGGSSAPRRDDARPPRRDDSRPPRREGGHGRSSGAGNPNRPPKRGPKKYFYGSAW